MNVREQVEETAAFIRQRTKIIPQIALILGSGLGGFADEIKVDLAIPYTDILAFPLSTVEGHDGQLVIGQIEGKSVVVMRGRVHLLEGYAPSKVVFPLRVMWKLGAKVLLVTNASGGLNRQWYAGDIMIIADHINFMGTNPLIGPNDLALGPRFPDMSQAYDPEMIALAERTAMAERIPIRKGVYVAVHGPSFETPAELRMLRRWGADAVGMSTVPEVIAARHLGMRVLGISVVTDMATGEQVQSLTSAEVIAMAKQVEPKFFRLLKGVLRDLPHQFASDHLLTSD